MDRCDKILSTLCNICGLFTPISKQRYFTKGLQEKYTAFYNISPVICAFSPNKLCISCSSFLHETKKSRNLPTYPMVWRAPNHMHTDCFACCMPPLNGKKWKDRKNIEYPQQSSSDRPLYDTNRDRSRSPIETDIVTALASNLSGALETSSYATLSPPNSSFVNPLSATLSSGSTYEPPTANQPQAPLLFSQKSLNDLGKDLELPHEKMELLNSRLKEKRALKKGVKITSRDATDAFKSKYTEVIYKTKKGKPQTIAYINDIEGLFDLFGQPHNPADWRLFIDSNKKSLKFVLLHNKNEYPIIPIAYSLDPKENYEDFKKILKWIKYDQYKWRIVADYKVINILMGLKQGNAKFPCFLCLWDRTAKINHYERNYWPVRTHRHQIPLYSSIHPPLVPQQQILPPVLHIKIGLVTQLMKYIYKNNNDAQTYLSGTIFPGLTEAKLEAGVFNGPDIRKLFGDSAFLKTLSKKERDAFLNLKSVCNNFLGNNRADNYETLIENLKKSYQKLQLSVTLKMHILFCHLETFPENCGQYSDEQGERSHQELLKTEFSYRGKNIRNAMADYCWRTTRESDTTAHKRQDKNHKKTGYFLLNGNKQ